LGNIGDAYHLLGRYDEAVTSYRQAAEAFQDLGEIFYAADTFFDLSKTFKAAGRDEEARIATAAGLHLTEANP
jgi:tetratricopeptide (TPR) repeat protein